MNTSIQKKIDFAVIIGVNNANPNGDPLYANRPRQTIDRLGEISDVCLKRKIRNRLLAMGEKIFVQSDDNRTDDCRSLKERFDASGIKKEEVRVEGPKKWLDVRAFGQLFAFKKKDSKGKGRAKNDEEATDSYSSGGDTAAVSVGIRGPVTIQSAYSTEAIAPESIQITKSVNLEVEKGQDPDKKGPDTMGMKHRVASAVYVAYGAITPQLAAKTGFSDEDAAKIKMALRSLFEGDASSARPEGSMEIKAVIWCNHNSLCGQYSSAHVHRAIKEGIAKDGSIDKTIIKQKLEGLAIEFLGSLEGEELAALSRGTTE